MSVIESSAFSLTEEQLAIREAIDDLCKPFDNDYWRELDAKHALPGEVRRRPLRRRLDEHAHPRGVRRWRRRHP